MILVCPACDAKFNIPAGAISDKGRKVRCARCQHEWNATTADLQESAPVPPPPAMPQPNAAAMAQPAMQQQRPVETPVNFDGEMDANTVAETAAIRQSVREEIAPSAPESAPNDDTFDDDISEADDFGGEDDFSSTGEDFGASLREKYGSEFLDDEEDDDDDFVTRRRAEQRKQNERDLIARERRVMLIGWTALLLFILASLYFVFIDRTLMRAYLPNAAAFFDDSGEEVASVNVMRAEAEAIAKAEGKELTPSNAEAIEIVVANLRRDSTGVERRDGQLALVLRGYVENKGRTAAKVPQVLAQIYDANGQVIDSWVFDPPGLIIRRDGQLNFEQVRTPVPAGTANVQVTVVKGSRSATEGVYPS